MRILLIGLLLLVSACKYDSYVVMGDSMSDDHCEWPNHIIKWGFDNPGWGFPHLQVSAQPGIGVINYDFPSHQLGNGYQKAALYALGTNDAYFYRTPLSEYRDKLASDMAQAASQNLPVVCMLPWRLPHNPARADPYRAISMEVCPQWIDVPLLLDDSADGVHMSCASSESFALYVMDALGSL